MLGGRTESMLSEDDAEGVEEGFNSFISSKGGKEESGPSDPYSDSPWPSRL